MQTIDLLSDSPLLFALVAGLFGLLVGSFLNVVIHRLPIMMQQSWRKECSEYLGIETDGIDAAPYNLILPNSCCPACQTPIQAHQNIPIISYIFLGGKCAVCKTPISLRYPLIEALSALLSFITAWRFGFCIQTGFALILTWSLIAMSFIDIDHHLLPDSITLPLLWLGLVLSLFTLFTDSQASIIGATAGYLTLWSVFHLFKLITGKEGMGYGDFKLLALFGAWLGWQYIPLIILLSSLVGAVIGIGMILIVRHDRNKPIPFGPYLAAAGWIALLWGEQINGYYLKAIGL
jgi:leader peptidase (prepilin peptidase) / N-methyltransferase